MTPQQLILHWISVPSAQLESSTNTSAYMSSVCEKSVDMAFVFRCCIQADLYGQLLEPAR